MLPLIGSTLLSIFAYTHVSDVLIVFAIAAQRVINKRSCDLTSDIDGWLEPHDNDVG